VAVQILLLDRQGTERASRYCLRTAVELVGLEVLGVLVVTLRAFPMGRPPVLIHLSTVPETLLTHRTPNNFSPCSTGVSFSWVQSLLAFLANLPLLIGSSKCPVGLADIQNSLCDRLPEIDQVSLGDHQILVDLEQRSLQPSFLHSSCQYCKSILAILKP
jgi:hypothetical protein